MIEIHYLFAFLRSIKIIRSEMYSLVSFQNMSTFLLNEIRFRWKIKLDEIKWKSAVCRVQSFECINECGCTQIKLCVTLGMQLVQSSKNMITACKPALVTE